AESFEAFESDEALRTHDLAVLAAHHDLATARVAEAKAIDASGAQIDLRLRRPSLAATEPPLHQLRLRPRVEDQVPRRVEVTAHHDLAVATRGQTQQLASHC